MHCLITLIQFQQEEVCNLDCDHRRKYGTDEIQEICNIIHRVYNCCNRSKHSYHDCHMFSIPFVHNGQVLTYENALAKTPFCRLSNGSTRDGREALGSKDYPYLKIVDCPLDIESKEQIQTITIDDMDAEVTGVDTAGYVLSVRVGNDTVSGEEFRTNYHLASSCFSFQKYDGKLRITTRGIGHGLGLSQYTANQMAKEGKSMEEILAHFFEGTELKEGVEIVQVEGGAGE